MSVFAPAATLCRRTSRPAALLVLLCWAAPARAGFVVWNAASFANDAAFNTYYGGAGTNYESFGGEARWGSNGPGGSTYEYNINRLRPGPTGPQFDFGVVTGHRTWGTGTNSSATATFTLEYSGDGSKTVNWTIGGSPTISLTSNFGAIDQLVVRAAVNARGDTRTLTLDQFSATGYAKATGGLVTEASPGAFAAVVAATSPATATTVAGVDYVAISGLDFTRAYTITGRLTFAWSGAVPTSPGTAFNMQIKNMLVSPNAPPPVSSVPAPPTAAAALLGALPALAWARRRGRC
jgi:hypothetical protein